MLQGGSSKHRAKYLPILMHFARTGFRDSSSCSRFMSPCSLCKCISACKCIQYNHSMLLSLGSRCVSRWLEQHCAKYLMIFMHCARTGFRDSASCSCSMSPCSLCKCIDGSSHMRHSCSMLSALGSRCASRWLEQHRAKYLLISMYYARTV